MDKEFNECPFCNSTNIKAIQKESLRKYKCENCGSIFGERGCPGPRPGNPG